MHAAYFLTVAITVFIKADIALLMKLLIAHRQNLLKKWD